MLGHLGGRRACPRAPLVQPSVKNDDQREPRSRTIIQHSRLLTQARKKDAMNDERQNTTPDFTVLRAALRTLDPLSVDIIYSALKVYERSSTPDDNRGHSFSMDIQDLLQLFPEDAKERCDNGPCTMLETGVHEATIRWIDDSHEPFVVVMKLKGSSDCPKVRMSKVQLEDMFFDVGIPEGTVPDRVKDFSCRVFVDSHVGQTEHGDKPRHRILAFLPGPTTVVSRGKTRFCQECGRLVADAIDNYFGVCPTCHKSNGGVNVGRYHYGYCKTHKTRWGIGENLFSDWKYETEEEQRQIYDALEFDSFEDVEPHHCE
jgi:hypothetical protein